MSPFLDLVGATGTAYRFRQPDGALSSIGGNFVYVRDEGGVPRVVCCGRARSLAWALSKPIWREDENAHEDDQRDTGNPEELPKEQCHRQRASDRADASSPAARLEPAS